MTTIGDGFYNPYGLVPAPPRPTEGPLADATPPGHDILGPGLWSGTIPLTIRLESPLLLLNQRTAQGRVVDVRVEQGVPVLEWTSVKGALRSVFEAVTNSRFAIVDDRHAAPLAIRQGAAHGLEVLLAQVDTLPGAAGTDGTARVVERLDYRGHDGVSPAVWVPIDLVTELFNPATTSVAGHGAEVDAWLELRRHDRWKSTPEFLFWQALTIVRAGTSLGDAPKTGGHRKSKAVTEGTGRILIRVTGKLVCGGKSFGRKHDERLLVTAVDPRDAGRVTHSVRTLPLDPAAPNRWISVFDSYRRARLDGEPPFPRSRHTLVNHTAERDLVPGALGFARVVGDRVTHVFPVMIGREPFPVSPWDLLDPDHRPASSLAELSPADRVFGWARPRGARAEASVDAYAGHVRGTPPICIDGPAAVETETFPETLWLTTLGTPRPEQYRFRLLDQQDRALPSGRPRSVEEGYQDGTGTDATGRSLPRRRLARSFYWMQPDLPDDYWRPMLDGTVSEPSAGEVAYEPQQASDGRYREYLAPFGLPDDAGNRGGTKKNVTRAVTGWVRPKTTFTLILTVENLEPQMLGLLLWLLGPAAGVRYGLGAGKPFGFGAATFTAGLADARLATGATWAAAYGTWIEDPEFATVEELEALVETRQVDEKATRELLALRSIGASRLVHTPRDRREPVVESYLWFTENERAGKRKAPGLPSGDPVLKYWI